MLPCELTLTVGSLKKSSSPRMLCVADFESHAHVILTKNAWDYYSTGANHQQTLRDNVKGFMR